MTDQTDKPKLGTRPPLGLKRTVETGKVKQSFSHGRSNTVVVEVNIYAVKTQLYESRPPSWLTIVGMAVATTVASIDARNRLSMIPAVIRTVRRRDTCMLLVRDWRLEIGD